MAICTICDEFTLSKTTCQLCLLGNEDKSINPTHDKNNMTHHHRLPMPQVFADEWLAGLLKTRVSGLFKTKSGLMGRLIQIQAEINRTKNSETFVKNNHVTKKGKAAYNKIAESIIAAAQDTNFDFTEQVVEFPGNYKCLKIGRRNMTLTASWR